METTCCNPDDDCCGTHDRCCNSDNPCCGNDDPCDPLCGDPCLCLECNDDNPCTLDSCQGGGCQYAEKCPGQNCCDDGTCCAEQCEECLDPGSLSGGAISVNPNPACVDSTITFILSGVVDSGGVKRVDCYSSMPDGTDPPVYTWTLTIPADYPDPLPPLSGPGRVASVLAKTPGTYTCRFTATAQRDLCPPPSLVIGPATANVLPPTCDAQLDDGGGSQGDTIQLPRIITNTSSCQVTFDWQVTTSGAPTVTPNPASGSVTLHPGQSDNTPLTVVIALISVTGTETLTFTVTNGGSTICTDTATLTVCDQCQTFNGTQCVPKPLCTSCTPQSSSCTPPGYACDGSGVCKRGQDLVAQIAGQLGITYANQSTLGCSPGQCKRPSEPLLTDPLSWRAC